MIIAIIHIIFGLVSLTITKAELTKEEKIYALHIGATTNAVTINPKDMYAEGFG